MTKPIIVVKMSCELLYHSSERKVLPSWPYLISKLLVSLVTMLLLIGLTLFLQPGCFCLTFIPIAIYKQVLTRNLILSSYAE